VRIVRGVHDLMDRAELRCDVLPAAGWMRNRREVRRPVGHQSAIHTPAKVHRCTLTT
jgi:hypothetical protein